MSNADKIFKELGYTEDESYNLISYEKDEGEHLYTIVFDTANKTFYKGSTCQDDAISMQELQAINEKIKELGWDKE